jgi:hypothetical protein
MLQPSLADNGPMQMANLGSRPPGPAPRPAYESSCNVLWLSFLPSFLRTANGRLARLQISKKADYLVTWLVVSMSHPFADTCLMQDAPELGAGFS